MIFIVRHAMPKLQPGVDPSAWVLSRDGEESARAIGHLLPPAAALVASDEPKAYATLSVATGRQVVTDPRLREVHRPPEPFGEDFRLARTEYVAGRPPHGWEPPHLVASRIEAVAAEYGRPLVMAGHGMAFTTWLAYRGLVRNPAVFWNDLRLPDVFVLTDDGTFRRVV